MKTLISDTRRLFPLSLALGLFTSIQQARSEVIVYFEELPGNMVKVSWTGTLNLALTDNVFGPYGYGAGDLRTGQNYSTLTGHYQATTAGTSANIPHPTSGQEVRYPTTEGSWGFYGTGIHFDAEVVSAGSLTWPTQLSFDPARQTYYINSVTLAQIGASSFNGTLAWTANGTGDTIRYTTGPVPISTPQASAATLAISEIHYHPLPPSVAEDPENLYSGDDFEFIELQNIGTETISLTQSAFTSGILFDFSSGSVSQLQPGQRALVVSNLAAFQARYPSVTAASIAGQYTGNLDNSGSGIVLTGSGGTVIRGLNYSNSSPWPIPANESGHSLVLVDPTSNPDHADPASWRASIAAGGNPGNTDTDAFT